MTNTEAFEHPQHTDPADAARPLEPPSGQVHPQPVEWTIEALNALDLDNLSADDPQLRILLSTGC